MVRFFVLPPDAELDAEAIKLGDVAAAAGLARIHFLAWRDLDDPEAGGSEVHAHEIARRWARAGIDITFRTSYAPGLAQVAWRDGYRVIRRAGRYAVFPRAVFSEATGRHGPRDALVEIWNGMPFFSPVWAKGPSITFLHHVHAEMWDMTLPPNLARVGRAIESTLAPPLYRRERIVTLSESSREELVDDLHFRADRVSVVEPGIDARFTPGPEPHERDADPLVVAVGRLVPVKRFDQLIDTLATLKPRHPRLRAVIVGEGYERAALESKIASHGAEEWIELPGRVDDAELVSLYRRAWVVASASAREGWGMTLTEAAACGTPAVVTDIAGHRDAIEHDVTGILARDPAALAAGIERIVSDDALRERMSSAAAERASRFTWDATARRVLEVLADEARRVRAR
jgi:glycosyltransferase involved in cell wall biosynthesis